MNSSSQSVMSFFSSKHCKNSSVCLFSWITSEITNFPVSCKKAGSNNSSFKSKSILDIHVLTIFVAKKLS